MTEFVHEDMVADIEGAVGVAELNERELKLIDYKVAVCEVLPERVTMKVPPYGVALVRGNMLYDFGPKGGSITGPAGVAVVAVHGGAQFHALMQARILVGVLRDEREVRSRQALGLSLAFFAGSISMLLMKSPVCGVGTVAVLAAAVVILSGVVSKRVRQGYQPSAREEVKGLQMLHVVAKRTNDGDVGGTGRAMPDGNSPGERQLLSMALSQEAGGRGVEGVEVKSSADSENSEYDNDGIGRMVGHA